MASSSNRKSTLLAISVLGGGIALGIYLFEGSFSFSRSEQEIEVLVEQVRIESQQQKMARLFGKNIIELVQIPGGRFQMGDVNNTAGKGSKPVHEVTLLSLSVGKFPITFDQYDAFAAATARERPSDEGYGRGNRPVINVNWYDAKAFVEWLSTETKDDYRLLSEAEWEYAARAGSSTDYPWGNQIGDGNAHCKDCGGNWDGTTTSPVDTFPANEYGLHDMIGNTYDWLEDCYVGNYEGAPNDGSAQAVTDECETRILRGGYFAWPSYELGVAQRGQSLPSVKSKDSGFRIASSNAMLGQKRTTTVIVEEALEDILGL